MSTEIMGREHGHRRQAQAKTSGADLVTALLGIIALFCAIILVFTVGGFVASAIGGVTACAGISMITKASDGTGG